MHTGSWVFYRLNEKVAQTVSSGLDLLAKVSFPFFFFLKLKRTSLIFAFMVSFIGCLPVDVVDKRSESEKSLASATFFFLPSSSWTYLRPNATLTH